MKNKGFRRGDVFMAELRAEPGSVEHGRRPVVILQNNIGNLYAPTLIVAPITSRPRKHGCQATQYPCLLYTSPSPRDMRRSRMPSSA